MAKKKSVVKIPSELSGTAGEYFVAGQLSRLGHIASINLKNTKGVDILAMNTKATRSVMIQVKANQGSERKWLMSKKAETMINDSLFYVFVNLNGVDGLPDFYVVPSAAVAQYGKETHQRWLDTKGKKGQDHNDNKMRVFRDPNDQYKGRWDLLGL